jgi:hypothetical protein
MDSIALTEDDGQGGSQVPRNTVLIILRAGFFVSASVALIVRTSNQGKSESG